MMNYGRVKTGREGECETVKKQKKRRRGCHKETGALAICPFFEREKNGRLYCECCRLDFKDKLMRRELVYRFCAHTEQYKDCEIYKALCRYYERREKGERYEE